MTNSKNLKREPGRPQNLSDEEMKQMALEIKYKNHGIKLTPSLLERETSIGRNTWSRRMKNYIDELNNPIMTSPSSDEEILFPSIELIFKKFNDNEIALKNELLNFQVLFYDIYAELQKYKEKEQKYKEFIDKYDILKKEISKQKARANHYEQLYNQLTVSSVFPHLQENANSPLQKYNLKENLISLDKYKNKGTSLENLEEFFPVISQNNEDNPEKEVRKKQNNFKKLQDKFDL